MNEEIFDSNPFKKEEKKTLPEVIISQIDKCAQEFSKEMKKGFVHKEVVDGQMVLLTHPDQRYTAINHSKTLYDLLIFYFDKELKDKIKIIKKQMEEIKKRNFEYYLLIEMDTRQKRIAAQTNNFPSTQAGDISNDNYLNELTECYRTMFQELVLLFKRKNELSGKRIISYDTR